MAYTFRRDKGKSERVLRPVRPNVGAEAAFRRRLIQEIEAMAKVVEYCIEQCYRQTPPAMAQDAVAANDLRDVLQSLSQQWSKKFDALSNWLAEYFAKDAEERSSASLASALRRYGMSVRFMMTPAMRDILSATVHENVSLIRSIPQQYLQQVEGIVMRSVQTGRDLGQLSTDLQTRLGVAKKRAALIARDQNNKATSAFTRARQVELGINEAIWMHSHAGKKPRPTHVKMDGKKYDVTKGMYDRDEGRYVFPGELINCRCTSRSVIPGFT